MTSEDMNSLMSLYTTKICSSSHCFNEPFHFNTVCTFPNVMKNENTPQEKRYMYTQANFYPIPLRVYLPPGGILPPGAKGACKQGFRLHFSLPFRLIVVSEELPFIEKDIITVLYI